MHVPAIREVADGLEALKGQGLVRDWALPYESLLTRLDAAIFFLEPVRETDLKEIWQALGKHPGFQYQKNDKQLLSELAWQVEFNKPAAGTKTTKKPAAKKKRVKKPGVKANARQKK